MNENIKKAIKSAKLCQWQVAQELSISESTITRWLRTELSSEKQLRILNAINNLKSKEMN